jgi:hypothetical protein
MRRRDWHAGAQNQRQDGLLGALPAAAWALGPIWMLPASGRCIRAEQKRIVLLLLRRLLLRLLLLLLRRRRRRGFSRPRQDTARDTTAQGALFWRSSAGGGLRAGPGQGRWPGARWSRVLSRGGRRVVRLCPLLWVCVRVCVCVCCLVLSGCCLRWSFSAGSDLDWGGPGGSPLWPAVLAGPPIHPPPSPAPPLRRASGTSFGPGLYRICFRLFRYK